MERRIGAEVAIGRSWNTSSGVEVELSLLREGEEVGADSEEERRVVA